MKQSRLRAVVAGLITLLVFACLLLFFRPAEQASLGQPKQNKSRPRPPEKPITMSTDLVQLHIVLGLKDKRNTVWDGNIHLSEGKIHSLVLVGGNAKGKLTGTNWLVRSVRMKKMGMAVNRPALRATLQAPLSSQVTINTPEGKFSFALADIPVDGKKFFLKRQASVERRAGPTQFARPETEDDYPVMAKAPDGTIWLAYNEYMRGPKLIKERVLAGNFDALVPTGNGDQVRLKKFDGKTWHPSIAVTEPGLNIWRPSIAIDGKGNIVVAWAQQVNGNWDIFYRKYSPAAGGKGTWSKAVRVTKVPGSDFHVAAATDSNGVVWLAWQGWRDKHFNIMLTALTNNSPYSTPKAISTSKRNNWTPAIAADSKGNVYVAWDAYDGDSYNVHLAQISNGKIQRRDIAKSARFEARPFIICDAKDRLWIAYEEGDEQWGKDYATAAVLKIPDVPRNPGNGLYLDRTIKVKCLVNGKLMQPAGDLQAAFKGKKKKKNLPRNKSVPRLVVDSSGGVWLWLRHHPTPGGGGEVWVSFALRYDGKKWSEPRRIASSTCLMDNRPALLAFKDGVLEVHSSDNRKRSANREDTDLYAVFLQTPGKAMPQPKLVADQPVTKRNLKPVHPKEAEHVARIRKYRIEHNGKKLRLLRGEFHRHTEYTAHRDGDGLFEDTWRYALDAGMLDWMGNGDHDNGFGYEYPWWQIQKFTDIVNHPPTFVAALTYERSNRFPNGHRNVMMPKRGIRPLPRGNLKGTAEKGTPDTKMLYAYLKHFGGMCSSHTSGTNMGTDWRDNDPAVEPVVEIYQGHRHNYEVYGAPRAPSKKKQIGGYQPSGFVWNALGKKGYRLGFQSSSDHISTHMSYGMVLADDTSRQGIIDAFKRRHSYAATDNIIMEVRSGKQLMGDIFTTNERPKLEIKVLGTAPITKLHVVRNNEYIYSIKPGKKEIDITFTDMQPLAGKEAYYYVRIEQADENLAWASPMWITYKPKR